MTSCISRRIVPWRSPPCPRDSPSMRPPPARKRFIQRPCVRGRSGPERRGREVARPLTEDERLEERVPPEPVRAVNADARALPHREQSVDVGLPVLVARRRRPSSSADPAGPVSASRSGRRRRSPSLSGGCRAASLDDARRPGGACRGARNLRPSNPRPSFTSVWMARATMSRGASSITRRRVVAP